MNKIKLTILYLFFIFIIPLYGNDDLKISIILDDVGYSKNEIEQLKDFNEALTVAIFPRYKYSKFLSKQAVKNGFEVIIHMPMEPINNLDPGKNAIYSSMNNNEILKVLDKNIKSIPLAIGINNHMGSRITQDYACMNLILTELKKRGMLFIDSMVVPNTYSQKIAKEFNMTIFKRDVFLDNIDEEQAIKEQIRELINIAKKNKKAIGIGHINKIYTISTLMSMIDEIKSEGINFCYVSEMI